MSLLYRLLEFAVLSQRAAGQLRSLAIDGSDEMSLLWAKNRGLLASTGELADFRYSFHGMGCMFEFNTGEIVDVELPPTDIPLFDHWRVVQFLKSHGEVGTQSEIEVALQDLVEKEILFEGPAGWFSLAQGVWSRR